MVALLRIMTQAYKFIVLPFFIFWSNSAVSGSLFDEVGRDAGVSPVILYGIAVQESSPVGKNKPWPWTINVAGKGYWFNTKAEAVQAIKLAVRAGIENIDVGMMQVSLKWHDDKFKSYEDALDPKKNLQVAASILKDFSHYPLFVAIGKYHCPSNVDWCKTAAQNYAFNVVGRIKSFL